MPIIKGELGTRATDMCGKRTYDEDDDGSVTPSLSETYADQLFADAEFNETQVGGLSPGERTYNV